MVEKFRWLAGVIAAHPNHRVEGRMRLQATMLLLQELGLPTDYGYRRFFDGPYSEGLYADVGLLVHFGFVEQTRKSDDGETFWYALTASSEAVLPQIKPFQKYIDVMQAASPHVLELAATYSIFRAQGDGHSEALEGVRRKKASKCQGNNMELALDLLEKLGLPSALGHSSARKVS